MNVFSYSKRVRFASIALAVILIVLLGWTIYRLLTRPAPIANDRFGLAFISSPDHLADEARYQGALAAGARWDRWPLYWHWVAAGGYTGPHEGGQHDYDTLVVEEIEHGLTPLVILMGTPPEEAQPAVAPAPTVEADLPLRETPIEVSTATLPPTSLDQPIFADGTDNPAPGKAVNPANAWAAFVTATVERYRPGGELARRQGWAAGVGIRHWEIWNEPDYDLFWRGSVGEYYRLLEVAYKTIKAADPTATVALGGLAFYEQPGWLGEFLRQTGGDPDRAYFDVFSMHHYWSIYNSEARLQESRALLDAFGLAETPIWITESGLAVWDDYPATAHDVNPDTPWRGTMAEQSAYLIEHAALAFYYGAERYFHFMLHDDCGDGPSTAYGLRQNFDDSVCSPAEGALRPAYAAYQLAAEQFHDLIPLWRERNNEQDRLAFYRPADQARVLVAWATQGMTVTTTISATGDSATLYRIDPHQRNFRLETALSPAAERYTLTLPPATNQNAFDPEDSGYHIGGSPVVLVERDTRPPETVIAPLPPSSPPTFVVTWQGQDRGSGIAGYEVWVGRDEEELTIWLPEITETQAEFAGEIGHAYRFAVRARDRASNQAAAPTTTQASTEIIDGATLSGVVLGPDGQLVPDATVTITGGATQLSLVTTPTGDWSIALLPGAYDVQAAAPGFAGWPAPRSITVDASGAITLTVAPADNRLSSGDFEGSEVWDVWNWTGQVDQTNDALDGQAAVRLGRGRGEATRCARGRSGQQWLLQQTVDLAHTTAPTLSFWYNITAPNAKVDDARLAVNVMTGSGRLHRLTPPVEGWRLGRWAFTTFDLSAWRGETVVVQFDVVRCSEQAFTVALDRVAVGNTPQK